MADLTVPCKVQKGSGGSVYYFDGINPPTLLLGGVGTVLNTLAGGTMPVVVLSTTDFDNLQQHFLGRLRAFASIAACETCPEGAATFDEIVTEACS